MGSRSKDPRSSSQMQDQPGALRTIASLAASCDNTAAKLLKSLRKIDAITTPTNNANKTLTVIAGNMSRTVEILESSRSYFDCGERCGFKVRKLAGELSVGGSICTSSVTDCIGAVSQCSEALAFFNSRMNMKAAKEALEDLHMVLSEGRKALREVIRRRLEGRGSVRRKTMFGREFDEDDEDNQDTDMLEDPPPPPPQSSSPDSVSSFLSPSLTRNSFSLSISSMSSSLTPNDKPETARQARRRLSSTASEGRVVQTQAWEEFLPI